MYRDIDDFDDSKLASEAFRVAFSTAGTCEVTCPFCHTEHISLEQYNNWDYDDDEAPDEHRKKILEMASEKPEEYMIHDYDGISCCDFGFGLIPVECPCNGLEKYENFLLRNAKQIGIFFTERVKIAQEQIKTEDTIATLVDDCEILDLVHRFNQIHKRREVEEVPIS